MNLKTCKDCLPHVEFSYNRSVHSITKFSHFEIAYSFNPVTPLHLIPLPFTKCIKLDGKKKAIMLKMIHEKVKQKTEKRTEQYETQANKRAKESCVLAW